MCKIRSSLLSPCGYMLYVVSYIKHATVLTLHMSIKQDCLVGAWAIFIALYFLQCIRITRHPVFLFFSSKFSTYSEILLCHLYQRFNCRNKRCVYLATGLRAVLWPYSVTRRRYFFCTSTLWQFLLTEVTIGNDDILMEVNISKISSIL